MSKHEEMIKTDDKSINILKAINILNRFYACGMGDRLLNLKNGSTRQEFLEAMYPPVDYETKQKIKTLLGENP